MSILALSHFNGIVAVIQISERQYHILVDERRFLALPDKERSAFVTLMFTALSEATTNGWSNTYLADCFDFTVTRMPEARAREMYDLFHPSR